MTQRIWGRIRLFLLLCGIWGALFFTIANVNSDVWFFPTMDFYVLHRIGHIYILFLLIKGVLLNGELLRRSGKKSSELAIIVFAYSLFLPLTLIPAMDSGSRWWRTLVPLSSMEKYFALYKEYPFSVDLTDLISFIFLFICLLICCIPSKNLSFIIQRNISEVLKYLWPYQKKDSEDIYEVQKYEDILNAFLPDKRTLEEKNALARDFYYGYSCYMLIICLPFTLIAGVLMLMFGKGFMLKMVGDYEQAEMSKIENNREGKFFDRISLYALIIFISLYIPLLIISDYVNISNIYVRGAALTIVLLITFLLNLGTIIWAGNDNLTVVKKIQKQELFGLSKKNKNWMLLYAHQLINTGQTILDDVSLLREKDEIELRLDDLQVNTQLLLDDGEKCLNYAQALSKQPVIEAINLITICKKVVADIEDDRKTATLCAEDDIMLEYSGDATSYLVKTDENILQKILYELIANAVSYRIPQTAVTITLEKKEAIMHMNIENAVFLKDAQKLQKYLQKIDAFWNWQNVSSAGDIRLGLVFTKGYAEMVGIEINYDVNNKLTFSANLDIPIA